MKNKLRYKPVTYYYSNDMDDNEMKHILKKYKDKVVGYIRGGDTDSILRQRNIIFDFCKDLNVKCKQFYIDEGYSGINMNRPGIHKITQLGESKVILTSSISRFSRSMIEMDRYICEKNKIVIGISERVVIGSNKDL